jgi:predicted nucleic acid-binding Zn ribbon protein
VKRAGWAGERLGEILERAVVRPARRQRSAVGRARKMWVAAAGEETAAHSWPRNVRRGVLTVEVDSSALLAELAGYRRAALLGALAGGLGIRDLRFVLAENVK